MGSHLRIDQNRPSYDVTNLDEGAIIDLIGQVISDRNDPESLFTQGDRLALCETTAGGELRFLRDIDSTLLRAWLTSQAVFERQVIQNQVPTMVPHTLVSETLKAFLVLGEWEGAPPIKDVAQDPYMLKDGTIVSEYGYNPESQIFCARANADSLQVMDTPSKEHVDRAKHLLLDDALGDFEFLSETDRANCMAALLTSVTRYMYDCPLPLYLIDSTNPGSGKGYMASVIGSVWGSYKLQPISGDDEEIRKKVLSILMENEKVIVFDNVEHTLGGPTLNALLTSTTYSDRKLGASQQITFPNNKLWMATGNNIQLGKDMGRRSVWIRQDPKTNPLLRNTEKKNWRHPNLIQWCDENHDALVWACLTLARSWVAGGMQMSSVTADNSKEWSYVVGGILEYHGISGFLQERTVKAVMDDETEEMMDFIESLARALPDPLADFTPRDINQILSGIDGPEVGENLPAQVRRIWEKGGSATKSLGKWLEQHKGRYAGPHGWRVTKVSPDTDREKIYRLDLDHVTIEKLRNERSLKVNTRASF